MIGLAADMNMSGFSCYLLLVRETGRGLQKKKQGNGEDGWSEKDLAWPDFMPVSQVIWSGQE